MGLFDFFKKKNTEPQLPKENDTSSLDMSLLKMHELMFPKGQEQKEELTKQLCSKLGNRYNYDVVINNYIFVMSCMFIDSDKTFEAVAGKVADRRNNPFSKQDIKTIYDFAIDNNDQLSKIVGSSVAKELDSVIEMMTKDQPALDKLPEGRGEFGYDVRNPIPIKGIPNNEVYLSSLRLPDGQGITWNRVGSRLSENIPHPVDVYEIFSKKGRILNNIYLYPYCGKNSEEAPRGLFFKDKMPTFSLNGDCHLYLFTANWCGPSRRLEKEFMEAGFDSYEIINVDDEADLCAQYKVRNVPTMILLDGQGEIICRWVGYNDENPGQSYLINYIVSLNLRLSGSVAEEPQCVGEIMTDNDASYAVSDTGEPLVVYYRNESDIFMETPERPGDDGYYLDIRKPLVLDAKEIERDGYVNVPVIPEGCDGVIINGEGLLEHSGYLYCGCADGYNGKIFVVRDVNSQVMNAAFSDDVSNEYLEEDLPFE